MALAMTLRFHGLSFFGGLVLAAIAGYGLYVYEPLLASLGVTTPVAYDWFFMGATVVGVLMVVRALVKGRALAR